MCRFTAFNISKMSFATDLLQAFINKNDKNVVDLLQRNDVATWINNKVLLKNLRNHGVTRENIRQAGEATMEKPIYFETVLSYICTFSEARYLSNILQNGADVQVLSEYANTCLHRVFLSYVDAHEKFDVIIEHCKANGVDIKDLCARQNEYKSCVVSYVVERGFVDCLDVVIKHGARIDIPDQDGDTPLQIASLFGHVQCLQRLLQENNNINWKGFQGKTALVRSAENGHFECVSVLLEHGADVEVQDQYGDRAVHLAARFGHTKCLEILLRSNADIESKGFKGKSPLLRASEYGKSDCVNVLLRHGANVEADDDFGGRAIHYASMGGHVTCVDLLLEYKAEIEAHFPHNKTALLLACEHSRLNCVELLLKHRANIEVQNADGDRPIHIALLSAYDERADSVDFLLKDRAFVLAKHDDNSDEPVQLALLSGCEERKDCLDVLLKHGANVDVPDNDSDRPIHIASMCGDANSIKRLISFGAKIDAIDSRQRTALSLTAINGNVECMDLLIKHGANLEVHDEDGDRPLHLASLYGNSDCVERLLQAFAYIDTKNHAGQTALICATSMGHDECVAILLKHGANVNLCDAFNDPALHFAAHYNHANCVRQLLSANANIEQNDIYGNTPLLVAAFAGSIQAFKALLLAHADITATDKHQNSLLHFACMGRNGLQIVENILEFGFNANIRNAEGTTVLATAVLNNANSDIIKILASFGADVNAKTGPKQIALHWAAERGNLECARTLLSLGSSVNEQDVDGLTPLMLAVSMPENHENLIELLLDNNADVNLVDSSGRSALHIASLKGQSKNVNALKCKTLNYNLQDNNGATALHLAAAFDQFETAEFLVKDINVDVFIEDKQGRTALQIAKFRNITSIIELIEKHIDSQATGLDVNQRKRNFCEIENPFYSSTPTKLRRTEQNNSALSSKLIMALAMFNICSISLFCYFIF